MAKGTTVATAYVQVMPSMEGATSNITDAILPQINGAGDGLGKELGSSLGAGFKGMLDKLLPAATVAALATAASKALFEVGQTFDNMTDSIIIGTGASGEALDSLIGSAEKIATTIPASFEDAGDVVQNLNTRLGITGDELENLGARVLEAGNLIGEKLNLDSLTGALNAFGVSNEEAAGKLDYLFNVSQATGVGLNNLLGTLKKQAPALKELGFSFEESANIIGTMDKMGLDASSTMGKLSKVLAEAADNGEPARDAYERIVGELQHYLEIGDEVSALQLADEVFGTRGSAQFLDAVKSGALSLDNMKNSALGAGDGILGTMERTMSFGESLELLKNNALAALEPLASPIFDGLSGIMQKLTGILEKARGSFASIASVVGGVLTIAFNAVGGALDFLGGIFQTVFAFFEPILDALATGFDKITAALGLNAEEASEDSGIWQMLGDVFGFVGDLIATVITPVISVLSGVISAIMEPVQALADKFSSLWNTVREVWDSIKEKIQGVVDWIKGIFDFELEFPHIALPHFSVTGEFSADPPSVPAFEVTGYYAQGGIVGGPSLIMAGEAGPEAIVPLTAPNIAPFADAVAERVQGGGDTYIFNITADSETTLQRLVREANQARRQYA